MEIHSNTSEKNHHFIITKSHTLIITRQTRQKWWSRPSK